MTRFETPVFLACVRRTVHRNATVPRVGTLFGSAGQRQEKGQRMTATAVGGVRDREASVSPATPPRPATLVRDFPVITTLRDTSVSAKVSQLKIFSTN